MARLILFIVLLAGMAQAVLAGLAALRGFSAADDSESDPTGLPAPLRAISYTFMMVLLLGVSTGWLGAS